MGPCKSGPPDDRQGCGFFGGFSWHHTSEGARLRPHKIKFYQDGSIVQISWKRRIRLQERFLTGKESLVRFANPLLKFVQFCLRFARRVRDGHSRLLQPGQNLRLGERGRLGGEVDVRVRIESRSTSSSSSTSSTTPHARTGLDAMRDGPVVEGDDLGGGERGVGTLLHHLHLLHVGRGGLAGCALRGRAAEPEHSSV